MERTSILTGDVISEPASFHSHIEVNLEGTDVSNLYTTMTDRIMEAISNFQRQGSNWVFKDIISLEIHTVKYEPLRGNSYIPLPQKLASKKAITNMKNEDDMCFMWSVLRALNPIEKQLSLLKLKGVYPYDYVDGLEKLAETQLPPKEEFYSKLSGDDISDEDYVHAQHVWKEFEYVLLPADVFETFRDVCLTNYNLDPAWYYTAPGLAWDAALILTEVELELLTDPDMLLMIEKGIRGGVSTIMTRYGKANNKYMGDEFDPKKDTVHMKKTKIRFDKPVYLGMCILDLSKTLMYEFHYYYIKPNYILDACDTSGAKLLFTDTDSLAYEIKTEDLYADMIENVEQMFDTSNFPADHPSGIKSGVNKKVVGTFKDDGGGKIMHEFVGLRAKLYSYRMYKGKGSSLANEPMARPKEEKRCKGVKQSVVKKEISFDDYKTCLFSRKEQLRKMNVIRSHGHEIFMEEVNKIALSANDDKRVIQEDGVHTLAYGHWRLRLKGALRPHIGLARLPDR
ncbi:hypothetical protein MAR_033444 [Mya arenaria]|uniref:DNA-directed DNA polymerase n=1 Tax=Mya arenaria TaxID=6604 RepID=A0ABY7GAF7_MYAAR|nr:hypothetical protein MAR_033444 [Mya arenaria]